MADRDAKAEMASGNDESGSSAEGARGADSDESPSSKARISDGDEAGDKPDENDDGSPKRKTALMDASSVSSENLSDEGASVASKRREIRLRPSPVTQQTFASRTGKTPVGQKGLSDVTQLLFSINRSFANEEAQPKGQRKVTQSSKQSAEQRASKSKTHGSSSLPAKRDLAPALPASSKSPQRQDSPGKKRSASATPKRTPKRALSLPEREAVERITREYQRGNDPAAPHDRNTFALGQTPPRATPKEAAHDGLLSRFVTYRDQRTPAPVQATPGGRRYKPLAQHSPKSDRKGRTAERPPVPRQRNEADIDGVILCSMQNERPVSPLRTPENQFPRKAKPGPGKGGSSTPPPRDDQSYPRNDIPLLFDTLRIFVIICCVASVAARCYVAFGGKFSPLHYMINSPVLWLVKSYTVVFHVALILVELDVGVPGVVPKKTLDNFVQRGCLISFLGLLDLCMTSNKSMADVVNEVSGGVYSERGLWMRCAFLVLGVSSRGLAATGVVYLFLGIAGYDGETRRGTNARAAAHRAKTRRASI